MEITNFLLNNLQFTGANLGKYNESDNSKGSTSFDSQYQNYKNQYNTNDNIKKDISKREVIKKDISKKEIYNDKIVKDDIKKENVSQENVKGENNKKVSNKSKKINNNSNESNPQKEMSEEVVKQLSEKLGISVDEINSILQQLNLTVFDLLDNKNINSFIQKLLNIDNPIDLLVSSDAQNTYKQVMSVIEENRDSLKNTFELQDISNVLVDEEVLEERALKTDNIISSNSENVKNTANNLTNSNSKENLQTDIIQNEENVPIIEISNETKGNEQSKDNFNNNNQSYNNPNNIQASVSNENYNNINNFAMTDIGKQIISDKIVNETTLNTQSSKDIYQIINQIVEKIKVDIKSDISEMKLILKPDHLGELSLKITTENNIITAQFIAESQQVKEVLQSNFNNLKDTLQQLGLIVDNISVSVGQQNSGARQQFEQSQEKSKRRIEKIIEGIDTLGEVDVVYNENYINPYEVSDNQVDYMA